LVLVVLAFAAACGDGDSEDPTSTPAATDTPRATATSTAEPEPTATPTPAGPLQVPSLVQLVDVQSGEVTTLFESLEGRAYSSEFRSDRIVVETVVDVEAREAERETLVFDLNGSLVDEEPPQAPSAYECLMVNGEQRCGFPSPGGTWSLQHRNNREGSAAGGGTVPLSDLWLVNLTTGDERLILEAYTHCGGCDGAYGPRWAPGGEFVVFAETGGSGRRFLTEAATGETQQIGNGQGISQAPDWSSDGQWLLYPEQFQGATILLNVETGAEEIIDLQWPVAFDTTGSRMYSPAWAPHPDPKQDGGSYTTTVVDVATREVLYELPGAPSWTYVWTDEIALVETDIGVVAALQDSAGCDGTVIYVDGRSTGCVEGGALATVGSAGLVAVAVLQGHHDGYATGPGLATVDVAEYDVVVVDPTTGAAVARSEGILTSRWDAGLYLEWDESETRLLVGNFYSPGL
jgi:hypothetical protein